MNAIRTRWAAVGAAVAVTLGAGGVSLTQAALDSGDRSVFVAIEPCRLIDTRGGVGSRDTPLGAREVLALQVTGSTGQCSGIPADATAAALNVTAIQGSTRSFLTLFPADTSAPNASNLNWNGGDPPTPNKVDVKLSGSGAVRIANDAGTVHVAVDLVGYYIDHTHDDRYYTKDQLYTRSQVYTRSQIDAGLAQIEDQIDQLGNQLSQKANASDVYTRSQLYTRSQIDGFLDLKADQADLDALLAEPAASVSTFSQGPLATIGDGADTTVVTAQITPPADGDVIALGIAPGDPASSFACSLSETDDAMEAASTQVGGPGESQVVPVSGLTVAEGVLRTVYLVCEGVGGTVDIDGASVRLIFFPD